MFNSISNIFNKFRSKENSNEDKSNESINIIDSKQIPKSILSIKNELSRVFQDCDDFIVREIQLGEKVQCNILIVYIDKLINKYELINGVINPIMNYSKDNYKNIKISKQSITSSLMENILSSSQVKVLNEFHQTISSILSGYAIIYIDENDKAIQVDSRGWTERNIEQPNSEATVRGPRESFVESLGTNISLLRRKIKNTRFKIEEYNIGRQSHTDIAVCYLKGIVNEDIISTVRRRIEKIKIDAVLDSGYIEQFIEDAPFSFFPTVGNSEKPDRVAAKILEGKVAILCDGSPTVLTVPFIFIESMQSSDDYYSRFIWGAMNRLIRFIALIITILLPGLYVAFVAFHSNIIPLNLLTSIAISLEGLPFTPFMEALFMSTVFELLKEAGIRIPRPFGQAISIVGALVIGEAAVNAGLVSEIMIIIIGLTGICSFIIPPIQGSMHLIRVIVMIAANTLGFLGISMVLTFIIIHICSLRSFGVPYSSPFAPLHKSDLKDTFIRFPLWMMNTRPESFMSKSSQNKYRMEKTTIKKED